MAETAPMLKKLPMPRKVLALLCFARLAPSNRGDDDYGRSNERKDDFCPPSFLDSLTAIPAGRPARQLLRPFALLCTDDSKGSRAILIIVILRSNMYSGVSSEEAPADIPFRLLACLLSRQPLAAFSLRR